MTRSNSLPFALCIFGLIACGDTDKDGLSDSQEESLGTDPTKADSDGDGLSDFDEVEEHGTDPTKADSDDDTYWDSWELTEGTDPLNADSRIYTGYWPYQPDKDDGLAPADAVLQVGTPLARVELMDQFGEMVDLYDFSKQGKLTIVDVSAIWCPPCNGIASWLSGGPDNYGWGSSYPNIANYVHEGKIQWLTVLGENNSGVVPTEADLAAWYEQYPDPNIPVLADTSDQVFTYNYVDGGWPTIFLLDGEMVIGVVPGGDFYQALDYVNSLDL